MTRIFTEGFEMGDSLFFDSSGGGGGVSVSSSTPRSGTYSFRTLQASTATKNITGVSELYVRMGINSIAGGWNDANRQFTMQGATQQAFGFSILGSTLRYYNGTSSTDVVLSFTVTTGAWWLVEVYFKMAAAGGRIVIKIDGVTVVDFTGNTKPVADATVTSLIWRSGAGGGSVEIAWDDLGMNDTDNSNGLGDNSWCGDAHVIALLPNGNGTANQFTGSDGNSTDNYLLVDERPPNSDTDYVEDGTAGHQDMYAMADFDASGGKSIVRVWAECRAKDTVAAGGQIKVGVRTESTVYVSAGKTLLTSYTAIKGTEYKTNPNTGLGWSDAEADAVEFVAEVV